MIDQDEPKTILIIDDHELFAIGFAQLLAMFWPGSRVDTAESAATADQMMAGLLYDLVFLDIHLADSNGKIELPTFAKKYPETTFVMLSASDANPDVRYCLNNGAAGFLPKNLSIEKLKEALRTIQSGQIYTPPCYHYYDSSSAMTRQEQVIIKYLKLGMSDKEIAKELNIAVSTSSRHVHNIMKKLNISSRHQIR